MPGTGFLELALRAGQEVGANHLAELILEAPLLLPQSGAVQLQVAIKATEGSEDFELSIHSRPQAGGQEEDGQEEEAPWTRHASATLSSQEPTAQAFEASEWPPAGAEPLESESFYERVGAIGLDYGPAFQGLEAAWRRGEEIYAEISLAQEQVGEAERFGIHPALLDAALHPGFLAIDPSEVKGMRLPFSFAGVHLHEGRGASALRVRLGAAGERIRLDATDQDGVAVATIEALSLREVDPAQLGSAAVKSDALFGIEWAALELPEAASAASETELPEQSAAGESESGLPDAAAEPGVELFECRSDPGADPIAATHALCAEVLERLQAHLAAPEQDARLAFLTKGAMALEPSEAPDPAAAAAWGLIRSAQSEHPGRFTVIDTDASAASKQALVAALAITEEPQLALREGLARAPRLAKAAPQADLKAPELDPDATVLITGGLSGLGALTARHLVSEHGAKQLLLSSRRGPEAPGADELIAELAALGCEAKAVACDVSDREQVKELLAQIPAAHPLGAVYHSAVVLDDGVIDSLDPERLDRVLAPKADGAWHLHEATRDMELSDFVLYSSAAASFGSPGQGNYAAANSFLDALAYRRRAEGLAATAVAWGMWGQEGGITAGLNEADLARISRAGLIPITAERGFELLAQCRSLTTPYAIAAPFDPGVLRTAARAGLLPPLLSNLVRLPARRSQAAAGTLARRLAGVASEQREAVVLTVVREQIAATLGYEKGEDVDPERNLLELGFDSLAAVELRNRLSTVAGTQILATVAFEHPTAAALATYLLARFEEESAGAPAGSSRGVTLRALMDNAHSQERMAEIAPVLIEMSKFYPSFAAAAELEEPPYSVSITREGASPRLVCVPSFIVGSGPHQFARIARTLDGRRAVTALSLPGFRNGERLPASWEAAVEALAASVLQAVGSEPFALAGFSSGGALAHSLAERLEDDGVPPEALVLIDSYLPAGAAAADTFAGVMAQLLEMDNAAIAIDDDHLIAMGAYIRLYGGWEPAAIAAPALMLRATDDHVLPTVGEEELPPWQLPESVAEVASDHLGMIADHAAESADAIDSWLTSRLSLQPVSADESRA